mmetsp:Transcript_60755/g.172694  ORF Transcript_60755/g.172694 Transcript_60755/m.172694 type:complete len:226 (+) Transcript_60755:1005-1682(+)
MVEPKAQVHAAVLPEPLLQGWVPPVLRHDWGPVHCTEDPGEGQYRHVRQLADLLLIPLRRPPDHEELVAAVLVGGAVELVHHAVHYLGDLVHEGHDVVLQHLRCDTEVPDAGGTDDALDSGALHHRIHAGTVEHLHVVRDDVGPGLAEPQGQQGPQLDDRLLQDHGLHDLACGLLGLACDDVDELLESVQLLLLSCLRFVHLLKLELLIGYFHRHEGVLTERVYF